MFYATVACGVLADVFWHEIKNHAKNVDLDAFVVMPNHVHGILVLNNDCNFYDNQNDKKRNDAKRGDEKRRDKACLISTTTPNNPSQHN